MKKFILILLFPIFAHGEPGPATQYLANESATLMDVGMIRLQTLASEFEQHNGFVWTDNAETRFASASVSPVYDRDDDKIYIYISAMNSETNLAQMEEGCRNAMTQMNIWLQKSLPTIFLHVSYEDPELPGNFSESLKDMFELRCAFSSSRSTAEGRFWAHRPLGSLGDDEVTIGKWKMKNE